MNKKNEPLDRTEAILTRERETPARWHYVSFASRSKFRGAAIVMAHGLLDATMECHRLKINPGGEVIAFLLGEEVPVPAEQWRNKLLTESDVRTIFPDAQSLGEFEDADVK